MTSLRKLAIGAAVAVTLGLSAGAANALPAQTDEDQAFAQAEQLIRKRQLLSRTQLKCVSLIVSSITARVAVIDVREKHDAKCGGDPAVSPRLFSIEIDLKTGEAKWDNNPEMEMRPIPKQGIARRGR